MNSVRMISDVPKDKLDQVVKDLEYEFGKDKVRITPQPNGLFKVEYCNSENVPPLTGSAAPLLSKW